MLTLLKHEKFTNGSTNLEAIASVYSDNFNLCVLFAQTTKDGTPYGYVIGKNAQLDHENHTAKWSWGAYFTAFDAKMLQKRCSDAMLALMRLDWEK